MTYTLPLTLRTMGRIPLCLLAFVLLCQTWIGVSSAAPGEEDESGSHVNIVIAEVRIETSGAGGCGIYVVGHFDLNLKGSVATSGTRAAGIGAD